MEYKEVGGGSERASDVYGTLKFEIRCTPRAKGDPHRSIRRVHTSAATVAVLPEAEDVDVDVREADIKNGTLSASFHPQVAST